MLPSDWNRRHLSRFVALAIVLALFAAARLPALPDSERAALAARFRFTRQPMPEAEHGPYRTIRPVHPSLRRIAAWISSVGAAVALADLDGDGLPNDVCHVEPRTDHVVVAPAPDTGDRYAPFALEAAHPGYDARTVAPMGCLVSDLNEDGLLDVLVYYWGRTPLAFLRSRGTPGLPARLGPGEFLRVEVAPGGERWYTNAGLVADLDGDGHLDALFGNYFKDGARILDASGSGTESMHNTKSRSFNGGSKRVLRWRGASAAPDPTVDFEEIHGVFDERVAHGWTLAAGAADLDGDLLPELYFAHDFGPDRLLHNRSTPGRMRFAVVEGRRDAVTPSSCVLGRDSFKGMGVDFGDVNADGMPDIYVSNIADTFALQESHFLWLSTGHAAALRDGAAPYEHASEQLGVSRSGWGWDARLADFDNDGTLELIQATGFLQGTVNRWPELQALGTGNDQLMENPRHWPAFRAGDDVSGHNVPAFFVRRSTGRFHDLADAVGLAEPMVSRGIATGDVDGDGRLDLAVANQWQPSFVYRNASPSTARFLGLHLLLPPSPGPTRVRAGRPAADTPGRPAIGARAVVTHGGVSIAAHVDGGSGHSGKRSHEIHVGLGSAPAHEPVRVALHWRDPDGGRHATAIEVLPGWHTVVLGWPRIGGDHE